MALKHGLMVLNRAVEASEALVVGKSSRLEGDVKHGETVLMLTAVIDPQSGIAGKLGYILESSAPFGHEDHPQLPFLCFFVWLKSFPFFF